VYRPKHYVRLAPFMAHRVDGAVQHYNSVIYFISRRGTFTKGNDTLESFLSELAVESNVRKKPCTCVIKTFAVFFFRNKLSRLEHVLFLQVFFGKSLSTASFERKLSSVSLRLCPMDTGLLNCLSHCLSSCSNIYLCKMRRLVDRFC